MKIEISINTVNNKWCKIWHTKDAPSLLLPPLRCSPVQTPSFVDDVIDRPYQFWNIFM